MRSNREKGFVPALGYSYDWLLRGYDTLLALSRLGRTFKREVVRAAALSGQERIADIGCGTGVLLREAVISHPGLSIVGVDPDERILRIARRSMPARASQRVTLQREYAHGLSFEDRSFDVCFSTLTFHHLSLSQKRQAAAEMHRVLDQDGRAIIADFRSVRFPFFSKFFIFENAEYLRQNFQGGGTRCIGFGWVFPYRGDPSSFFFGEYFYCLEIVRWLVSGDRRIRIRAHH